MSENDARSSSACSWGACHYSTNEYRVSTHGADRRIRCQSPRAVRTRLSRARLTALSSHTYHDVCTVFENVNVTLIINNDDLTESRNAHRAVSPRKHVNNARIMRRFYHHDFVNLQTARSYLIVSRKFEYLKMPKSMLLVTTMWNWRHRFTITLGRPVWSRK